MRSYLSLIPISAKVRKRQNRMTMLCIIISVLLVTMIFSMADMAIRMERMRVVEEHGNWHIMLKELSEQQIEQIAQRTDVLAFSRYHGLNYDLSESYTAVSYTHLAHMPHLRTDSSIYGILKEAVEKNF